MEHTTEPAPAAAEDRRLGLLAAVLAALAVACGVAAVVAEDAGGRSGDRVPIWLGDVVLGSAWPLIGALVVRAAPRNPVGWLMLVPGLLGPYQLAGVYADASGGEGPLGTLAAWYAVWGFAPYFFTLPVLPMVFPDGRPPSRRWSRLLAVTLGVATVTTVARMLSPIGSDLAPGGVNPFGVDGALWLRYVTSVGAVSLFVVFLPLAVLSLFWRRRRAVEPERTQLSWIFLGGIVLVAGATMPLGTAAEGWGMVVGLLAFPLAIGLGMLRHGLFDAEFALHRTVVLGLVTAAVVAAYVAVVYGARAVAPGSRLDVLLVAVLALLAALARDRVQRLVDRWLFRHAPLAVVARVGRGVAGAADPGSALQSLVAEARAALRLPSMAFVPVEGASVSSGAPAHGTRGLPVQALGLEVGTLEVGLPTRRHRWTEAEERALAEVADRAGTLAYAARLVADVSRSRERIVAAREEERRRMRADLHDGVAPALAGTALQLESMATRLRRDGHVELADRALGLRDGLRDTVGELRALVHGLRPPVLDQRGLAGAVRALVTGLDEPVCTADVEEVGAPGAAVEVAAYAIAAEGLANALRHASASRVELGLHTDEGVLVVTVRDDGSGLPAEPVAGVGLGSMRERAAEVGGQVRVEAAPGGGTVVTARLPLVPEAGRG